MINKFTLKVINLVEGILRFFVFLCLFQEVFSLFTNQEGELESLITEYNTIGIVLYIFVFLVAFIWVFKSIFEKIVKKVYNVENINEVKIAFVFINTVRTISLITLLVFGIFTLNNIDTENTKLYVPKTVEFKINNSTANIKMKFQNDNLYYSVSISNFKYPSSDFMARTVITFIDRDGFEINKKVIQLKEYAQNGSDIEYVSHIPMSKENYKNISKVSLNYINPTDSLNSFARILDNFEK
ncbi:hypothetical protein IJI31_02220 [bacterium]|nr:hypothetical protein [bacterium]